MLTGRFHIDERILTVTAGFFVVQVLLLMRKSRFSSIIISQISLSADLSAPEAVGSSIFIITSSRADMA